MGINTWGYECAIRVRNGMLFIPLYDLAVIFPLIPVRDMHNLPLS